MTNEEYVKEALSKLIKKFKNGEVSVERLVDGFTEDNQFIFTVNNVKVGISEFVVYLDNIKVNIDLDNIKSLFLDMQDAYYLREDENEKLIYEETINKLKQELGD